MSSPGSCENHCSTPMLYHSSDLQMEELVNSQTLDLSASLRRRKWQPTPVFLPGKSHGQRRLAGYAHGVTKSQTRLSKHPLFTHRKSLGYIYMEASIWATTLLISTFLIFNILNLSTGTFNH